MRPHSGMYQGLITMVRKVAMKINSSVQQNLANLHLISKGAINLDVLQQV